MSDKSNDVPTRDELIKELRRADSLNAALVKAARNSEPLDTHLKAVEEHRRYIGDNANYISIIVDSLIDENERLRSLLDTALEATQNDE